MNVPPGSPGSPGPSGPLGPYGSQGQSGPRAPAPHGPRLEPYRPSESASVSGYAVASLVLGICSFAVCLGPVGAIPAIILGFLAQREIARSEGRIGGATMGVLGATIGMLNVLGIASLIAWAIYDNAHSPHSPPSVSPPFAYTTTPPGPPGPTAPGPSPTSGPKPKSGRSGGEITVLPQVVETKIGNVTMVDVPATTRTLKEELRAQVKKARSAQEQLVLFTTFDQCRPCMSASAILLDPKMQTALENVRLVRVDTNEMKEELEELNIPTANAPGFFLLGADLRATDGVTGGEWDDDVPDNIAPVLGPFVRGKLKRRKEPFHGSGVGSSPHEKGGQGGGNTGGKGSYL